MKKNKKKGLSLLVGFCLLLLFFEGLSVLSLIALSLQNIPYPFSFLLLLQHGFYKEVLISSFILAVPLGIVLAYLKKGLCRYIALMVSGIMLILGLSFYFGLVIFDFLDKDFDLSFSSLPFLFEWIERPISYKHFLEGQGLSFSLTLLIFGHWLFERFRPANKALGNAHFANGIEIQKTGLFKKEKESIIIGKKLGKTLYSNGFEHVLVFAPSGSGKTRSISIPNLFNYPFSVVCNDVKFTLFETTSGYREKVLGHKCYCWALANTESITHRFNPLSFISEDTMLRMIDIQRIAHIMIPDNPKEAPIWTKAPRKLFKALLLYLLDTPDKPTTLGEINRLVKQQNFDAWLLSILTKTKHYDPEFYRNGFSYINTHEETRANILETFVGYFELFDDPIVDAATSASDFDIRDLRREKLTIYIGFTDEDMERLAPILTLFWQQVISAMIKEIPDAIKEPYPLLCLIDEFSSLGRIERLRRSLKLLREYRVRCILMFQYIAQTYERYSHDEARAFTNIKTKIAYTTEDIHDAEFISKLLGTRTKRIVTNSVSTQHHGLSESKSVSYQAIPLLRPEEVGKLPMHISLIIRAGSSPIKARQFIWYKEPSMKKLPMGQTFVPKQTPKREAFEWYEAPDKKTKTKTTKTKTRETSQERSKESEAPVEEIQDFDWVALQEEGCNES